MSNKGCYERTKRVLTWLSVRRHHWEGCPKCRETHRAILRRLDVTSVEWRRGTVKNRLKGQECVEAAEKGSSALMCFTGPWADAERGQKQAIFLHYSSCDCGRGGGWGRSYSLCQIIRGQSTTRMACEAPGVSLKPTVVPWALWELRLSPCPGGTAGWAHQGAATVMPGLLPAAEHPPQAVGVSVQDAAFLCARQVLMTDEISATAPCSSPIWPDHSCGIDIMEDYSCQLQV